MLSADSLFFFERFSSVCSNKGIRRFFLHWDMIYDFWIFSLVINKNLELRFSMLNDSSNYFMGWHGNAFNIEYQLI